MCFVRYVRVLVCSSLIRACHAGRLELSSARPHFKTSDDQLVAWATAAKQDAKLGAPGHALYVTSDRELSQRLHAAGAIVCKPKEFLKFATAVLSAAPVATAASAAALAVETKSADTTTAATDNKTKAAPSTASSTSSSSSETSSSESSASDSESAARRRGDRRGDGKADGAGCSGIDRFVADFFASRTGGKKA